MNKTATKHGQVIGKPEVEPFVEQVEQESIVLERILNPDVHERLMEQAGIKGISPFKAANDYIVLGMLPEIAAQIQQRAGIVPKPTGTERLEADITGESHD